MKKIVFLEGLPGVGKSTIIKSIKQRGIPYVNCVEELINEDIFSNRSFGQEIFMKNDDMKIDKFSDGLIVIDRGPISTYAYNLVNSKLNGFNCDIIENWFMSYKKILKESTIYYLYNNDFYLPYENPEDPYGSIDNQILLDEVTRVIIEKYGLVYKFIKYDKNNMKELINEIII